MVDSPREEPRPDRLPDPTDGPRRLLWEAIQILLREDWPVGGRGAVINLVNQRIDELLRGVPPEGGPRPDEGEGGLVMTEFGPMPDSVVVGRRAAPMSEPRPDDCEAIIEGILLRHAEDRLAVRAAIDELMRVARSAGGQPPSDGMPRLTKEELAAVIAYAEYGSTRGNHADTGAWGPTPGPLTRHIPGMQSAVAKLRTAERGVSAVPPTEGHPT